MVGKQKHRKGSHQLYLGKTGRPSQKGQTLTIEIKFHLWKTWRNDMTQVFKS